MVNWFGCAGLCGYCVNYNLSGNNEKGLKMYEQELTLKESNAKLKDNLEDMVEAMILQARLIRARYDALRSEGF